MIQNNKHIILKNIKDEVDIRHSTDALVKYLMKTDRVNGLRNGKFYFYRALIIYVYEIDEAIVVYSKNKKKTN